MFFLFYQYNWLIILREGDKLISPATKYAKLCIISEGGISCNNNTLNQFIDSRSHVRDASKKDKAAIVANNINTKI